MTDKSFAALFPDKVGPWTYVTASGLVLPPQDQLSRFLYEQLLTRIYAEDNGPQVMMVLAYSSVQEGRLQVHRPEVCYPAAGFTILDNEPMAIPINPSFAIHGRFLVADRGARAGICLLLDARRAEHADPLVRPAAVHGQGQSTRAISPTACSRASRSSPRIARKRSRR